MRTFRWHRLTSALAVASRGFSATHLIGDFLADVPQEFNLTVPVAEFLALGYVIALAGLIAAAASYSRTGYLGLAIAGLLISSAQFVKSVPEMLLPGPWRLGVSSEVHAVGIAISGVLVTVTSLLAWREAGVSVEDS